MAARAPSSHQSTRHVGAFRTHNTNLAGRAQDKCRCVFLPRGLDGHQLCHQQMLHQKLIAKQQQRCHCHGHQMAVEQFIEGSACTFWRKTCSHFVLCFIQHLKWQNTPTVSNCTNCMGFHAPGCCYGKPTGCKGKLLTLATGRQRQKTATAKCKAPGCQ